MQIQLEQIQALTTDPASLLAGKKLATPGVWKELGYNSAAIWGLCQGSALYQVKVDRENLGTSCSCPSRKFPCKHALGLLLLAATAPDRIPEDEPADWVSDWLEKRQARKEKVLQTSPAEPKGVVDEKARQKRRDQRDGRVREGIERLEVWLQDLIRNGLAGLESRPRTFWEEQSKRLVDAQAGGLAGRVQRLGDLVRSGPQWPQRLLDELGRLHLLTEAYRQIETLPAGLQQEIRQQIGWTVSADELEASGELLRDDWVIIGQTVDDDDRLRTQRNWAVGLQTHRLALILQFAPGRQPFSETFLPGTVQSASLRFYPGACPVRAKVHERFSPPATFSGRLPGEPTIDSFLDTQSQLLAQHPFLGSMGAVLLDARVTLHGGCWYAVDRAEQGLPLIGRDYWKLLAITGGTPFDLCAEWTGWGLKPLGLLRDGQFRGITPGQDSI